MPPFALPVPIELLGLVLGTLNALLLITQIAASLGYGRRNARMLKRAARRVVALSREKRGLQKALNNTVAQYRSLRQSFGRRNTVAAPRVAFIVPPPLPIDPTQGEDPESWADDMLKTHVHPIALQRGLVRRQTIEVDVDQDLLRESIPPVPPHGPSVLSPTPIPPSGTNGAGAKSPAK